MQNLKLNYSKLLAVMLVFIYFLMPEIALAIDVPKPSFISNDGMEKIDEAGETITEYIAVAFGVVTGISVLSLAFMAYKGKMEEVWERAGNIITGALIFMIGGTIVFTIL